MKAIALVGSVLVVTAVVAAILVPAAPRTAQSRPEPRDQETDWEFEMPALAVSWQRDGADVVATVVQSDHPRLLDCRWASSAVIRETPHSGIINLTDYDPPSDLTGWPRGPGCPAMGYRHDPLLEFQDRDGDDRMSIGDRWVVHEVPVGAESDLVLVTQYWTVTQWYEFRWQAPEPSI